jgi:hypothetical protein
MKLLDKFISYLSHDRVEGVVLFLLSTVIMLALQLYHLRQWTHGLKGDNDRWEGPEILLYILIWMFPPMIFAEIFLQMKLSETVWWIYLGLTAFCLVGRWGLEWLLAFKTGANQVISTTTKEEKTIIKKEEKTEG